MRKTIFTMAAAALILGFSSCSREESNTPATDKYDVTLSFKNASTRADGPTAVDGATVTINNGYLCFVSANDAITKVYSISGAASDVATGGLNINNSELENQAVTLSDVPGTSTKVYMVANTGAVANLPAPTVGTTMTSYMARSMDVRDQGIYTSVTTVGNAPLVTGIAPDKKTAEITLSTSVSRIQIKNITFDGDVTGTVAGIFVNGYYPTMPLNGTATAGTWRNSTTASDYNEKSGSSIFPSVLKTFVYDEVDLNFDTDVLGTVTVEPTTTNGVWGYNLFASATPQVIIKLTDVVVGGQNLPEDQFITINGFRSASGQITTLLGGMIYTIETGSLVIKYENMSIEPGVTPLEVEVTVIPVTWQETVVFPNL